jgi:hypothetical protein
MANVDKFGIKGGKLLFQSNSILIDEKGDLDTNNIFGLVEPTVSALQFNHYKDQI